MKKIFLVLLSIFFIQSCGTPKEILEYRAKIKRENEANTKIILDFFFANIWNKPLKEVFKGAKLNKKNGATYKFFQIHKKLHSYGSIYNVTSYPAYVKECEPDHNPEFSFRISKYPVKEALGIYGYKIIFGLELKKLHKIYLFNKENKPLYQLNRKTGKMEQKFQQFCSRGDRFGGGDDSLVTPSLVSSKYYIRTVERKELLAAFIARGFPKEMVLGPNCFRDDGYGGKGERKLSCFIDGGVESKYEPYNVYFEHTRKTNALNHINIIGLSIPLADDEYSFAEIYKTRMNNPAYYKETLAYKESAIRKINSKYDHERAKDRAVHRAHKARQNWNAGNEVKTF
jgi:hypothetical protein